MEYPYSLVGYYCVSFEIFAIVRLLRCNAVSSQEKRSVSSAVEHRLHTAGVIGSIPIPTTRHEAQPSAGLFHALHLPKICQIFAIPIKISHKNNALGRFNTYLHTAGVTGSIPVPPTKDSKGRQSPALLAFRVSTWRSIRQVSSRPTGLLARSCHTSASRCLVPTPASTGLVDVEANTSCR